VRKQVNKQQTITTAKKTMSSFLPLLESSPSYQNFISGLHSEYTLKMYREHIVSYLKFRGHTDPSKLLKGDTKLLESYLVEYLQSEKEKNLSYSTLNQKFAAIKKFYIENDIENLRWYKIHKILGRKTKKTRDRTYTQQDMQKLLRYADHRMKLVILLLA
jgi:site-specific recombinase XerD